VAVGHPAKGADRLRSAAAATGERQLSTLTRRLVLDVARLDYTTPADVEAADAALAGTQGSLFPVLARAVRASADRDPASLDRVADDFRQLGFTLWAAEFSARAADRWSADGNQRAATASQRAAARLQGQVGSVRTTSLARSPAVDPLTRRQREIASLVADGRANAEIAAQLHVSVRTVETHLRTIYRKVGVANRRELAAVITAGGLADA
jgi:DNA-binding NarL/FixJ family response regulator